MPSALSPMETPMLVETHDRPAGAGTEAPGAGLRVLFVHNHYRSEQPSGEDRVVDQEIALLRAGGAHVVLFSRHSDDIATMSALGKARVIAEIPWSRRSAPSFTAR